MKITSFISDNCTYWWLSHSIAHAVVNNEDLIVFYGGKSRRVARYIRWREVWLNCICKRLLMDCSAQSSDSNIGICLLYYTFEYGYKYFIMIGMVCDALNLVLVLWLMRLLRGLTIWDKKWKTYVNWERWGMALASRPDKHQCGITFFHLYSRA